MACELSTRFRFAGGEEMNGFFIDKALTEDEREICLVLLDGGPLGRGLKDVKARGIAIFDIDALVESGIIEKTTLLQFARNLTENETVKNEINEWNNCGGYLSLRDRDEKSLFKNFEKALRIVEEGEIPKNTEVRYLVTPVLYQYLDLVYE
jgi:hypothetical protein